MKVNTPFILGVPGETYEEGLETIRFAIELNADIANFHTLAPYPGTELYDHVDRYGSMSERVEDYTFEAAGFVPYTMTREEILQLKQVAFKKFYTRPRYMLSQMMKARSRHEIRALWHGGVSLLQLLFKRNVFVEHGDSTDRFQGRTNAA
jgi:radical SAM superfamily enzyme YgiQ (UPF0313 family)